MRYFWPNLVLLVLVAAVLRAAILDEYLAINPIAENPWADGQTYWQMAGRMSRGQWLDSTPFLSAPLYPYFLGALRTLGLQFKGVYIVQIIMHLLTAIPIALATRLRFGPRAALISAAVFLALCEPAMTSMRIVANTLELALVALLWWLWASISERACANGAVPAPESAHSSLSVSSNAVATPPPAAAPTGSNMPSDSTCFASRSPSITVAILGGFLSGLIALAWPPAILIVPLFAFNLWRLSDGRRRWLGSASAIFAGLLTISPATIHNYHICGEFIPITAHSGITLRQGNAENSIGVYTYIPGISPHRSEMHKDTARVFKEHAGRDGSWSEIDAYFRREVLDFWSDNPLGTLTLFARKAYWYLTSWRYDDMMPLYFERLFGVARRAVLAPIQVPWIIGAALAGLLAVLRTPRRYAPEWSFLLLTFVVTVAFFYTQRYRLPAIPMFCGLAAYALNDYRRFWYPSLFALMLVVAPLPLHFLNSLTGFDDAEFIRSKFAATLAKSHVENGDARLSRGDVDAAEFRYQLALRVDPEYSPAMRQIGILSGKAGNVDKAIEFLEKAIRADAEDSLAYRNLYNALLLKKNYKRAAGILRRAAQLDPSDPALNLALAWLMAACPQDDVRDGRQALIFANRALSNTTNDPAPALDALAAAHAELGQFDEARVTASDALARARERRDQHLASEIARRLDHYRADHPWRAEPRPLQPKRNPSARTAAE